MADENDDETTFGEFMKYFDRALEKGGSAWLDKVRPNSSPTKSGADPIAEFFKTALQETKTELTTAREQLEKARDLMTPEQLTQWRLPKLVEPSGDGKKDTSGPPSNAKPQDSGSTPDGGSPPPPPKPRRKWL